MNFPEGDGDKGEALPAPSLATETTQSVYFKGCDSYGEAAVSARNVVVNSMVGDHDHGSSRVKFKNIVDYNWEHRMYAGRLLAVHVDGDYLAYGVKGPSGGMVRVVNRATSMRTLLKGMAGQVRDVAFACVSSPIMVACVDEAGDVFVHRLSQEADALQCRPLLRVQLPPDASPVDSRVMWCPYIPDADDPEPESESEDSAKLMLATKGNKAYIWNVGSLTARFGAQAANPLSLKDMANHYLCIEDHTQPIVDAAFSPDGTSLATASCDGFVMFFQIYMNMNSDTPRCLYKWSPHDGKALSSIFFLDNRNSTEQFWKFVVTGAERNSVLKIWSCQTWACLQTIIFASHPKHNNIALQAGLDQSAKYLLLSDIYRRALFILHFDHDCDESSPVYCKKISEFHLPSPILCFGIVDATLRRLKASSTCDDAFHENDILSPNESPDKFKQTDEETCSDSELVSNGHEFDDESNVRAVIRLYLIQPNRLQEGHITFSPYRSNSSIDKTIDITGCPDDTLNFNETLNDISHETDPPNIINSPQKISPFNDKDENSDRINATLVQQSQQLKNLLMRSNLPGGFAKQPPSPMASAGAIASSFVPLLPSPNVAASIQLPLNLMTPDAFSSTKQDEENGSMVASPDVRLSAGPLESDSFSADIPPLFSDIEMPLNPGFTQSQHPSNICENKFASGGSSPSREVQEILSVKGSDCYYEDSNTEEDFYSPKINHVTMHNNASHSAGSGDNNPTTWPSINLANIKEAKHRKSNCEVSDKSLNSSVNIPNIIDISTGDKVSNIISMEKQDNNNRMSYSPLPNNDLKLIISKLDKLDGFVREQQKEISVLKNELSTFRRIYQNNITQNSIEEPSVTAKIIDKAIRSNHVQLKQLIDAAIENRTETERIHRETLLSGVSQIMGAQIGEKLNSCVAHETRNTLAPLIERILDPVTRSLQLELSRKLTATDHLLTENIQKLVNNKTVTDNLSHSLAISVSNSTKEAFKQSIQTSLIPHLEKALNQMFKQLNQSFNSGTKEYLLAFDSCTKRTLEYVGAVDETLSKSKTVAAHLQNILDQQNKNNNLQQNQQTTKQLNNLNKDIQNTISTTLQGALEDHLLPIKECIKEQLAVQAAMLEDSVLSAVRSNTQTPAPGMIDVQLQQHHVENMLKSGQINAAFQYALSASDLKLVTFACNIANPRQVFCTPCPLLPNVLLSLIQQLSADMSSDTQLKCSYLGEAIMFLSADQENPSTKEHMPMVLKELQKQLNSFLLNNNSHSSAISLKLLLLATESLLKS